MKTTCYLQLVAKHDRCGHVIGVAAKHLSLNAPRIWTEGVHLVRLELEIPDAAFKATRVSISIPLEKLAADVKATVL